MAMEGFSISAAASVLFWAFEYGTAVKKPANNNIKMIRMGFIIYYAFCWLRLIARVLF
jgi:hypothetical protein